MALQVTGVQKTYGGVRAVAGVDITIHSGEILGVIGANGAGKTTLFDIISGFVRPDAGRIVLHGQDVTSMSAAQRAGFGLGRTFQDLRLIPSMTVAEVLALAHERHVDVREPVASVLGLPATLRSEASVKRRVDKLLEDVQPRPLRELIHLRAVNRDAPSGRARVRLRTPTVGADPG